MQIILEDEIERSNSGGTSLMGFVICAGRIGRCWEENVMEEMESGEVEYKFAEEFLTSLKKEFGGGEEESIKVAELRKLEQGGRTMEKFVQEFKQAARGSRYERRPLVEECHMQVPPIRKTTSPR